MAIHVGHLAYTGRRTEDVSLPQKPTMTANKGAIRSKILRKMRELEKSWPVSTREWEYLRTYIKEMAKHK